MKVIGPLFWLNSEYLVLLEMLVRIQTGTNSVISQFVNERGANLAN
jgi:hypothetical protein